MQSYNYYFNIDKELVKAYKCVNCSYKEKSKLIYLGLKIANVNNKRESDPVTHGHHWDIIDTNTVLLWGYSTYYG